jgi:Rrf2 family protein
MLKRRGLYALRALLELALDPGAWRSVQQLAAAQSIPAPMLEQLLLQLRRAGLVEARRGRSGGYRLTRPAASIPLAELLQAVSADPAVDLAMDPAVEIAEPLDAWPGWNPGDLSRAGDRVVMALERRLRQALQRELAELTLEELVFDLRSWQECLREGGGLMLG